MNIATTVSASFTGVTANVTSSCKGSAQFVNIFAMASTLAFLETTGIAGVKNCKANGDLPGVAGALDSTCFDRAAPATTGLDATATFNADTKMFDTTGCSARRTSEARRRLAAAAVTVADTPTIRVAAAMVATDTFAASLATVTASLTGTANIDAFTAAVTAKQTAITTAIDSGASMASFAGAMPPTADATAFTAGTLAGDAAVVSFADPTLKATATVATAATPTITATAVTTNTDAGTSGAAEFFLSFATIVGAALLW